MTALCCLATLALFIAMATLRVIARDEGFYVMAAKLVLLGREPYSTFFYPQPPLLPYLLAGWFSLTETSWVAARLFSALCTTLIATGLFLYGREKGGLFFALIALLLFSLCDYSLLWLSVAKAYAPSLLFLTFSFLLLLRMRSTATATLVGLTLGAAMSIRIVLAAAAPAFAVCLLLCPDARRHWKAFLTGLILGLLPVTYYILLDPGIFWFNNFGYHLIRSEASDASLAAQKWELLQSLIGLSTSGRSYSLQFPFLLTFGTLGGIVAATRHDRERFLFLAAILLFIAHLLPNPSYQQYFVVLVPLLVLLSTYFLHTISRRLAVPSIARLSFGIALVAWYCSFAPDAFKSWTISRIEPSTWATPHRRRDRNIWSVASISEQLRSFSGIRGFSQWPGFFLESDILPAVGTENQFGVRVAEQLSPEEKVRYRVRSLEDIERALAKGKIALVVLSEKKNKSLLAALHNGGYQLLTELGEARIYQRSTKVQASLYIGDRSDETPKSELIENSG